MIIKDISSKFNHIVNGAFHLAHYHPRYLGQDDEVSNLLLKFKDNIDPWVTRWANHAASELSGLTDIKIILREGSASKEIVEYADENKCDLIILGSNSQSKITELVIGSTSKTVMKNSKIPVLVIPLID